METHQRWLSATALALVWCGQAQAQATQTAEPEASDQAASSEKSDTQEIVITAQRRTENLMRTATSATVLSGSDLANKGVADVDALQFAAPSIVVNNFGQGNDFNVRGIGKAEHNTQTTTGVITYRDGAPTFPGYVQEEPYFDVANIQVLRGPQGTIVGQNATGGAVFLTTNDPVINGGVHGYVQANYGNYNDLGGEATVNIPVSSTFAARVAVYGERRDSFFDITGPGGSDNPKDNGDLKMLAGRLSLLWKPNKNLTILSKTDADYLNMGAYPASPYWQHLDEFPYGSGKTNPYKTDLFDITANTPQSARDKFIRSILKIEYAFDSGLKFRSISSFQKANTQYEADLDGTSSEIPDPTTGAIKNWYFFDDVDERQITQEFNIISPDNERFTWLAGAFGVWNKYWFKEPYQFIIDANYAVPNDSVFKPLFLYLLQGTNPTRSLAAFGQVGFNITDDLKLEAGGRYTASRSTNHVDVQQYGAYIRDDQSTKSDNFSYKVSLGWTANRDHYLYAFVATGFRPGGLNVPVGLGLPDPFKPEKVTSFEAGWKANLMDGHVRTTVNGFYNNYKNFQVVIGYPSFPTFGIELNVPDTTKIYGFEAETEMNFGAFSMNAGINVLHSSLGEFYATDPRLPSVLPCNPATGPESVTCIALKGQRQTYAPNFTFNVGAEYRFALKNGDKVIPRVNYGHVGSQWATLFENPALGDHLEDRNVLNAQLAWEHGTWTVTAYGTNLTDQHYPAALNSDLYFAGPPRQYGIRLNKVF